VTFARRPWTGSPVLVVLAVVVSAATSSDQARTYSQRAVAAREVYYECVPKPYGYDWAHATCALEYLEREYAVLDKQLRVILPKLRAKQRAQLEGAQRRWEASADRKCDADSHYIGEKYPGTMQIVDYKSCKGFEASLRIEWLEQHYRRVLYPEARDN
jgi:uncharacterized protein YecT (DUF1311 family)